MIKEKPNYNLEQGITLIALVITIIVMLILVSVTINMAINGGIFEYAKRAKKETENAIKEEQLLAEAIIKGQTIDDIVGTAVKDEWYGITEEMEIQEGVSEYHIKSCAELKKFANAVNAGNDFEGKTVYLDKNLDLQGNESKQWTPIGKDYGDLDDKPFNGIFDGKNHYISGMYIKTEENAGLFGSVDKGSIENVKTINGYVESNGLAGGVAAGFGSVHGDIVTHEYIKNCYNSCTVIGGYNVGGIVGTSYGNIEECYNIGKITARDGSDGVGGITGDAAFGVIKKCYNSGEIRMSADSSYNYAGGIAGWSEEGRLIIDNCYNIGTIKSSIKSSARAGGIISNLQDSSEIKNCYNIGQVEGKITGKIVGVVYDSTITNCYFLGTASDNAVGEIDGNLTVDATAKTETEMKTQEFVNLLNGAQTPAPWKYVPNGYPKLTWQK